MTRDDPDFGSWIQAMQRLIKADHVKTGPNALGAALEALKCVELIARGKSDQLESGSRL